jgi:small subunit ribosomal protein S19e
MIDLIEPRLLIDNVAKKLESKIKMPEWAKFVKTGAFKQGPPVQSNWWYLRAAAILRIVDLKGPIGVSKLRTKFGGKKNLGVKPDHYVKGSGKIIRVILQQLESVKLLEKAEKGIHKGRITTPEGKKLLYSTSKELSTVKKSSGKSKPKSDIKEVKSVDKKKDKSKDKKEVKTQKEAKSEPKKKDDKKDSVKNESKKEDASKKKEE